MRKGNWKKGGAVGSPAPAHTPRTGKEAMFWGQGFKDYPQRGRAASCMSAQWAGVRGRESLHKPPGSWVPEKQESSPTFPGPETENRIGHKARAVNSSWGCTAGARWGHSCLGEESERWRNRGLGAPTCWLDVSGIPAQVRSKTRSSAPDFRITPQKEEGGRKQMILLLLLF